MINGCEVIILDPAEKIEPLMAYYGLPLSSLKAVILTDATNLNWIECALKAHSIRIIT